MLKNGDINRYIWIGIVCTYVNQMHLNAVALLKDSDTVKCCYGEC
jgi:hypothetical protein